MSREGYGSEEVIIGENLVKLWAHAPEGDDIEISSMISKG